MDGDGVPSTLVRRFLRLFSSRAILARAPLRAAFIILKPVIWGVSSRITRYEGLIQNLGMGHNDGIEIPISD